MINLKDKYNLSLKTATVIDFGNCISVAQKLSKSYGKVYYHIPNVINGFASHEAYDIGRGVEGIHKVSDWASIFEETDIFIFPDLYFQDLQAFFKRMGKLVFGSGHGQKMESDRGYMKLLQKELGLPLNPYVEVTGMDELEEVLKKQENCYVKGSLRGDMETFKSVNYTLSREVLKELRHRLGIFDRQEKYIVETPIDAIGEIGYDGYVIDGKYPLETCCGIEIKDSFYVGKMTNYHQLPKQIRLIGDKLAPIFKSYDYRGAYSNEIRIDKKMNGFLIDQTCRFGAPPLDLNLEMYENFAEIIWDVASGTVPVIKYKYKWGCQFIMRSELAQTESIAIQFPKKFEDNIKIKNLVIDNGTHFYTRNSFVMKEVGSVVFCADTMDKAIKGAIEITKSIKSFDIKFNTDSAGEAEKQIKELIKNGIHFL